MYIAGSNHWFLKLLSKLDHPFIGARSNPSSELMSRVSLRLDHKPVIADWLNLKIIIKRDNLGNLLLTLTVQHRAKQLPASQALPKINPSRYFMMSFWESMVFIKIS